MIQCNRKYSKNVVYRVWTFMPRGGPFPPPTEAFLVCVCAHGRPNVYLLRAMYVCVCVRVCLTKTTYVCAYVFLCGCKQYILWLQCCLWHFVGLSLSPPPLSLSLPPLSLCVCVGDNMTGEPFAEAGEVWQGGWERVREEREREMGGKRQRWSGEDNREGEQLQKQALLQGEKQPSTTDSNSALILSTLLLADGFFFQVSLKAIVRYVHFFLLAVIFPRVRAGY